VAMELLKQGGGEGGRPLYIVGIPYRGGGPMMQDLLGGQIPMMFINQDVALPHIKAGKLRALAVTSLQRNPLYPDTPTIAETGVKGYEALSWSGLSAIKGTPQPVVDKLEAAMKKIMGSAEIRQRMDSVGFVIPAQGSGPYTQFVKGEIELWTRVIKTAGIKPQ
jgi:tripartite-type tricarboxylate transporter receptor subunit TctC